MGTVQAIHATQELVASLLQSPRCVEAGCGSVGHDPLEGSPRPALLKGMGAAKPGKPAGGAQAVTGLLGPGRGPG